MYRYLLLFLFFLLCIASLFVVDPAFVEAYTTPKWFWFIFTGAALVIVFLLLPSSTLKDNWLSDNRIIAGLCLTVVTLCTLQACYGILQYLYLLPANEGHRVSGSFDNPAGFSASLVAGFPFILYFIRKGHKWPQYVFVIAVGLVILAVCLSASRAGIVSLCVIGVAILFYKIKAKKRTKVLLSLSAFVLIVGGLYWLKKDSADGRLLVWQCCLEMMREKPFLGYGSGGFTANYMNFQESYFRAHSESPFTLLADTVTHPFNEYLLLIVNYGLVGFVLFLLFVGCVVYSWFRIKQKNTFTYITTLSLFSIAAFAFFSYPLRYPFVWLVSLISLFVILFQADYRLSFSKTVNKIIQFTAIIGLIILSIFSYDRMESEKVWTKIAHQSLVGNTELMIPYYEKLERSLSRSYLFLYNYAAELNVIEDYERSLQIAHQCEKLWADYDLQLLIGDNYQQTGQYTKALYHFEKAAYMCPVRFIPLHRMFRIYRDMGEKEKASLLAHQIINKPVKVMSNDIRRIKEDVESFYK